jgi:hypothetical protein
MAVDIVFTSLLIAAASDAAATDLYSTAAQVIPVLLLALAWDSKYLDRLRDEPRESVFWRKPRVAIWSYFGTGAALLAEAVCLLVVSSVLDPGVVAKGLTLVGIGALIGSIWTRIYVDIHRGTGWPGRRGRRPAG